jgi:transcriptional regulator with XRE-family HTH domain
MPDEANDPILTAAQCRMARAALQWSLGELAQRSKIHANTIGRLEGGGSSTASTQTLLRSVFGAAGVEFTNGDEPGVKLRKAKPR